MTRIKPSLPAEGIFLGRARVVGSAHPLVVTVRGGEVVDITSKDAPTVRDVCEMDDAAGYVGAGQGQDRSARSTRSPPTASRRTAIRRSHICFRRSTCRR